MSVSTASSKAHAARQEAFDRILSNHMLYCTVCDNNNGNCTVQTQPGCWRLNINNPFQPKPYEVDNTNPFYVTTPISASVRPLWKLAKMFK